MRIALLFEFGTLLGGERSMLAAIDEITGRTFEVLALAPPGGPLAVALRERGIEHVPFPFRDDTGKRLPLDDLRAELIALVARLRPDVLHANSLATGRLSGAVAPDLRCACVAHLRDISRHSAAALRDLAQNHLMLAVSRATRTFHIAQGLPADRIRVLYNGVDCETFQPRPPTGALRRELGLPADAFLILNVGQIGLRKGQDVLAAAAGNAEIGVRNAESADESALPTPHSALRPRHYLIVGERYSAKRESIEFERSIAHTFEAAGIGDRLHRLGYRDDVPRLMNEADLLVHAAHQEPLGRVLLEAAASGLPIVATDVGGTREILTDGESARLVPPGDPAALAQAIAELHADRALRAQFATAARQRILDRFTIQRSATALAAVWQELVDTRPDGLLT
ncbi:MAG: glycosyltransferase family 4 protein [Planctomycetales bacterium]